MGSSWSEVFLTFQATHSRTLLLTCATDCMPTRMLVVFQMSHFANDCFANVSSQFANVQKSVHKRLEVSLQMLLASICVEVSSHTL